MCAFLAGLTVLRSFGTRVDVGNVAAFLASDDAAFLTGSAVTVDGGWTA